jgi:hypothetical protein
MPSSRTAGALLQMPGPGMNAHVDTGRRAVFLPVARERAKKMPEESLRSASSGGNALSSGKKEASLLCEERLYSINQIRLVR